MACLSSSTLTKATSLNQTSLSIFATCQESTKHTHYCTMLNQMVWQRLNRTLEEQLAKYISQSGGEWNLYIPQFEIAYNSSVQVSTGFSPFSLVQVREPNLSLGVMCNCSPVVTSSTPGKPAAYAQDLTIPLSNAFTHAAKHSAANKQYQKILYDKKVLFHPHQPGNFALLDNPA